jgi:hypothetical protein
VIPQQGEVTVPGGDQRTPGRIHGMGGETMAFRLGRRWTVGHGCAIALAALFCTMLTACVPEVEPNDTNADANANNDFNWSKTAQGADHVYDGTLSEGSDDVDIWFLYTTTTSNDLTVKLQPPDTAGHDCAVAEVKKCNQQGQSWSDCPAANRISVDLLWNCPVLGGIHDSVSFSIGVNRLVRVEVAPFPDQGTFDYTWTAFAD